MKTIAIIATLDTKGAEVAFACERLREWGCRPLVIDVGVAGAPEIAADVAREQVLAAGGLALSDVDGRDKGRRIELMSEAIAAKLVALHHERAFDAVFAMGGVQNTLMAANAMKRLPVGVPKLILSTMASGKRLFGPYVGSRDIAIMHSVADISGINMVTRSVIVSALAAVAGMAGRGHGAIARPAQTVVGATMLGVTSGGVTAAARAMQAAGFETVSFHATGVGGSAMEDFIRQGAIGATLDLTLHEVTSEVLGGYCEGASGRLTAAAEAGIPQVIVPGAVDMLSCCTDFGTASFPCDWQSRKWIAHNANLLHVKLSAGEIVEVAALVARRLNASRGPVTVLIPRRGFCEAGAPGKGLYEPDVDAAFVSALRAALDAKVRWCEADFNINEPEFGELAAKELLAYLAKKPAARVAEAVG